MESCIQPTCSCRAYKAPKQSKGTLLQLRLGCQKCGHQALEHRKLTAIDRYIEQEVTKASKCGQCHHQIPTREIPLSPVFRRYDLIPLPNDDSTMTTEQENSIQCTCGGFQVQSLVRLWQKFRTLTLDKVKPALPTITCSFCQHPLSSHCVPDELKEEPKSSIDKAISQTRSTFTQLVVKNPTKLALTPLNAQSLLLIPPEHFYERMTLLAVRKSSESSTCDSQLELITVSKCFTSKKVDNIEEHKVSGVENGTVNSATDACSEMDVDKPQDDKISLAQTQASDVVTAGNGMETSPSGVTDQENSLVKKPATKKGTKRRRKASSASDDGAGTRKSARIAAKKKKIEVDVTLNGGQPSPATTVKLQLKELKASRDSTRSSKGKKSKTFCFSETMSHIEEEEMFSPLKWELERVEENCASFAQMLGKPDCFETRCTLPTDFSSLDSHLVMVAHDINHHVIKNLAKSEKNRGKMASQDHLEEEGKVNSKQRDSGILVAVCSEAGSMIQLTTVSPIISQLKDQERVGKPLWTLLTFSTPDTSPKVTSMAWSRTLEKEGDGPAVVHFSAGCIDGGLYTWKVILSSDNSSIEDTLPLVCQRNTKSQITVCSWALNGSSLMVGTILGEVLFYRVSQETVNPTGTAAASAAVAPELKMEHFQTIHCCGGSVRCATWSLDSRLLAVGASDDFIQILQCRDPHCGQETQHQPPPSGSTIFKYFKREDTSGRQKFVHTHSLRGHQSFVADVKFLRHCHYLVSIGWDSQILFWPNLLLPKSHLPSHHSHTHGQHKELPYTEVEPLGGYKLGPSAVVEFLPTAVHPLVSNSGLVVLLQNRLDGFTVVPCLKKSAR